MTTKTLDHLRSQISTLSESERAALARELIMSLDGPRDDSVEQAWNDEIVRRVSKVKSGKASQEAIEAAAWYEYEQPGLGTEFFAAVDATIDVIEENFIPLSPLPEEAGDTGAKRLILERFPYDIIAIDLPEETV